MSGGERGNPWCLAKFWFPHRLKTADLDRLAFYGRSRGTVVNSNDLTTCPSWVQAPNRRFTRIVFRRSLGHHSIPLPSYDDRCTLLGLAKLEHRLSVAQASFVAGILLNTIDTSSLLSRLHLYAPCRTLRYRFRLQLPICRTRFARNEM